MCLQASDLVSTHHVTAAWETTDSVATVFTALCNLHMRCCRQLMKRNTCKTYCYLNNSLCHFSSYIRVVDFLSCLFTGTHSSHVILFTALQELIEYDLATSNRYDLATDPQLKLFLHCTFLCNLFSNSTRQNMSV